jgi:hypothetical protein
LIELNFVVVSCSEAVLSVLEASLVGLKHQQEVLRGQIDRDSSDVTTLMAFFAFAEEEEDFSLKHLAHARCYYHVQKRSQTSYLQPFEEALAVSCSSRKTLRAVDLAGNDFGGS